MSIDNRDERLERRIADLNASDPQFAAAAPDDAISSAIARPGLRLAELVQTVFDGYADRPALGARAVEFTTDPGHRPHHSRTAAPLRHHHLSRALRARACDHQCVGRRSGPAGRPRRTARLHQRRLHLPRHGADRARRSFGSAADQRTRSQQLLPIVAETEPTAIAASVDYLSDAVELVLAGPQPARLIVFDYRPQVDDHRDAVADAKSRLAEAESSTTIEVLGEVIARGAKLPAVQADSDRRH